MLRKLWVGFFILTSLSAQASTAFACAMMDQVVMHHCCCGEAEMKPARTADEPPCCQQVVVVGASEATDDGAAVASKSSPPEIQPQMQVLATLDLAPVFAASGAAAWTEPSRPISRAGTLTYLHTQRLRI